MVVGRTILVIYLIYDRLKPDTPSISSENIRDIRIGVRDSFSSTDSRETLKLTEELREQALKRVRQVNTNVNIDNTHLKLQEVIYTDVSPNTKTAAIDSVLSEIARAENSNLDHVIYEDDTITEIGSYSLFIPQAPNLKIY